MPNSTFHIGYTLARDADPYLYADMAVWCNDNGAVIRDDGDSYHIVLQPEPTEDELKEARIAELEEYLSSTDYMVIKCMERGLSMAAEYPEDYVKRQEAREEIDRLRG